MHIKTTELSKRVRKELYENIVPFWMTKTVDTENGGFFGRIHNDLTIEKDAQKSLILTTRILWTFSALARKNKEEKYLKMARHAYTFLVAKFLDSTFGGMYWLVDNSGNVIDSKKKIYGQAFAIYSLSEFHAATDDSGALDLAIQIFERIETHNYDKQNKGYFETSNRDWSTAEDMQLSDADMNEVKSMNTHLHLMEAYTALFKVWKNERLKSKLEELVNIFIQHIIDPATFHMKLFFDELWQVKSQNISFGHDIEASWLLWETACVLGDERLKNQIAQISLNMVDVTVRDGFSARHAIFTERNGKGVISGNIQWWQQAEAVVGLVNAFKISGDDRYLLKATQAWDFIEQNFVDREKGEWFYEVSEEGSPAAHYNKVSEWKGPYHNGRACMEIINLLERI